MARSGEQNLPELLWQLSTQLTVSELAAHIKSQPAMRAALESIVLRNPQYWQDKLKRIFPEYANTAVNAELLYEVLDITMIDTEPPTIIQIAMAIDQASPYYTDRDLKALITYVRANTGILFIDTHELVLSLPELEERDNIYFILRDTLDLWQPIASVINELMKKEHYDLLLAVARHNSNFKAVAFRQSIIHGNGEASARLLKEFTIDDAFGNELVNLAIEHNNVAVLMQLGVPRDQIEPLMKRAVKENQSDVVNYLLDLVPADSTLSNSEELLNLASGDKKLFSKLAASDKIRKTARGLLDSVNSDMDNAIILLASGWYGYLPDAIRSTLSNSPANVIRLLDLVSPSSGTKVFDMGIPVMVGATNNPGVINTYLKIVDELAPMEWQEGVATEVIAGIKSTSLAELYYNEHIDKFGNIPDRDILLEHSNVYPIVDRVLQDYRSDPRLVFTNECRDSEIIELALDDGRIDEDNMDDLFISAVENGCLESVKALVEDERANPFTTTALLMAIQQEDRAIVDALFQSNYDIPDDLASSALKLAADIGLDHSFFKLLFQRLDPNR